MNKARELKPCPFCGCSEINGPHQREYIGDTYSPSWRAECRTCPAFVEVDGKNKEALAGAWNARAAQSVSVPVVQPLTPALATLAYQRAFAESDRVDFSLRIARHVAVLLMPLGQISTAELDRLHRCETALIYARSVLPADKWADDTRLIIDAAIAGERED